MSNKIAKNVLISLALLLCAALVFAACQPGNVFTPVEIPAEAEAEAPEDGTAEEPEVSQDKTSDVEDWMESEGVSKDDLEKHLKNTGLDKES